MKEDKDFDNILDIVGSAGKYQKVLLYLVLLPLSLSFPFLNNTIFMWDVPDHWCYVPGKDPTMSLETWKNMTLPLKKGADGKLRYHKCKMIDPDTGNVTKCLHGWNYSTTDYSSTIPSEHDWVCSKGHYIRDGFIMKSIGSAIGSLVFGILSDKFGRKPIFFVVLLVNIAFRTASLFLTNKIAVYLVFQVFSDLSFPAMFMLPAIIAAESSSSEYTSWIFGISWMVYVLGNSIMPLLAWLCKGWFLLGWISLIPGYLVFLCFFFLDESPRWLVTIGRKKEAVKILERIAKINGKAVDTNVIKVKVDNLRQKYEKEEKVGVSSLLNKYRLIKNSLMLTVAASMNLLLYEGLNRHATHLAGNRFINYFILALIELPGALITGKLTEITGRRWTGVAFYFVSVVGCVLSAIAVREPKSTALEIIGAVGIKFSASTISAILYLQETELFPTQIRSLGGGLVTTVADLIGISEPYILYTGKNHSSAPYIIMGGCSIIGGVAASFLPETYNQSLPDSVEAANRFGKDQKFFSFVPKSRKNLDVGKMNGTKDLNKI